MPCSRCCAGCGSLPSTADPARVRGPTEGFADSQTSSELDPMIKEVLSNLLQHTARSVSSPTASVHPLSVARCTQNADPLLERVAKAHSKAALCQPATPSSIRVGHDRRRHLVLSVAVPHTRDRVRGRCRNRGRHSLGIDGDREDACPEVHALSKLWASIMLDPTRDKTFTDNGLLLHKAALADGAQDSATFECCADATTAHMATRANAGHDF